MKKQNSIGQILKRNQILLLFIFIFSAHILASAQNFADHKKLGEDNYSAGRFQAAIENLSQAIKLKADEKDVYLIRGKAYFESEKYESAIADFTKFLEFEPKSYDAYTERGRAFIKLGNYAAALVDITNAINYSSVFLNDRFPVLFAVRASLHCIMGNYKLATSDEVSAVNLGAEIDEPCQALSVEELRYPREMTAEDYFERGRKHLENNQPFKAERDFTDAIRLRPDFAEAYFERGKITINDEEQINDFIKVIELKPDFAPAYYQLGLIYFLIDREKSSGYYTKTVELDPQNFEAHISLGNLDRLDGKRDQAIEHYTRAIEINPDDRTYYIRGNTYLEMKKFNESVADFTKSIEYRDDYYWGYINRAKAFRGLGMLRQARSDEQKAAEIGKPQ